MGTTLKRKRSDTAPVSPDMTPKRRSMCILQARFTGAHTSNSGASGAEAMVTIDDDSGENDTTETEASVPERKSVRDIGSTHEDLGGDNYCDYGDDAFVHSSAYSEAYGGPDNYPEPTGSSAHCFSIVPVADLVEGSNPVVAIVDPARGAQEVGHATHNMEIVHVVPSFSDTLNTLAEVALAESSLTMTPANPRSKASVSQATSPLPFIVQHLLRRDLEPTISPAFPAALRSKTFTFRGTLPIPPHVQSLLRRLEPSSLASLLAISFDDTVTDREAWVNDTVATDVYKECALGMSWLEWENSFTAFKAFFDGGVQVL
ncbi:hypothetical protein Pyn_29883 [Prunus yedoensis var. nudiflora]|uniref:Uncharacterized protein n=1 Tax=Prunus yedoensis var. nudiflora TaxID=2094558 RepID=A0A314Y9H9_PRUYE|nr:hypothetical protein Pyn_29883 [Prunus yedoensis var. nudiflora]